MSAIKNRENEWKFIPRGEKSISNQMNMTLTMQYHIIAKSKSYLIDYWGNDK